MRRHALSLLVSGALQLAAQNVPPIQMISAYYSTDGGKTFVSAWVNLGPGLVLVPPAIKGGHVTLSIDFSKMAPVMCDVQKLDVKVFAPTSTGTVVR